MRMFAFLPLLALVLACGDENPLQPNEELSITPGALELTVAASREGVKMVPFKGGGVWWSMLETLTEGEIADCDAVGGVPDVGGGVLNITHLGRAEYRMLNCWDASFEFVIYETGTAVAANGDQLSYYGSSDDGMLTGFDWLVPFEEGDYEIGPLSITGGTGRFVGATGSFISSGYAVLGDAGWEGTEDWDGEISSVGSSK